MISACRRNSRKDEEAVQEEIFQMTPFVTVEEEQKYNSNSNCESGRYSRLCRYHKGNTKQKGIDEIIARFGFKLEETMSFGDGGNDISMLRHAAIGSHGQP